MKDGNKKTIKNILIAGMLLTMLCLFYTTDQPLLTNEKNDTELGLFNFSEPENSKLVLFINEPWANNTKICFYDRNGTLIFSGDYTNETLLNTSLNLNMTLRQFIFIIMPTFDATADVYNVFEQIAYQLKTLQL